MRHSPPLSAVLASQAEVSRFGGRPASKPPTDPLLDAFPVVDPLIRPAGNMLLCQVRRARKSKDLGNGKVLHYSDDAVDTERWNTQVAKVIAVGPLAYQNRNTLQPWPEGAWARVGDYVRVAKYTPDRWEVQYGPGDEEKALFILIKDVDVLGIVTGDPLAVRAFV